MADTNFFYNIKELQANGLVNLDMLCNALLKSYITTDQFIELAGENDALEGIKTVQITKTKSGLSDYLSAHPYETSDGKKYSVTFEKQSLLANEIATYQLATAAGQEYKLTWNTTGEECVEMAIEQITALALQIAAYVKPLVSYQQTKEIEIKDCATVEAVLAVEVNYGNI